MWCHMIRYHPVSHVVQPNVLTQALLMSILISENPTYLHISSHKVENLKSRITFKNSAIVLLLNY